MFFVPDPHDFALSNAYKISTNRDNEVKIVCVSPVFVIQSLYKRFARPEKNKRKGVNSYDSFEVVGNYYHAMIDGANIIIHFDNAGRIVSFDYSKSDYSKTLKWQYGDFVVKPV